MRRPSLLPATVLAAILLAGGIAPPDGNAEVLPFGPEFQVNAYTTDTQYGSPARSVARNPDGSFVVVWQDFGRDGTGFAEVVGQRYDAAGAAVGTEIEVNTYTTDHQTRAAVSSAPDGSFVVVWSSLDYQDGDGSGVFGQRFDGAGAPAGTEFQVNTYTSYNQFRPAVASASDGSFVVVWESLAADGSDNAIVARRYDASGAPLGTEFQINTYTTLDQTEGVVSSFADGGFVVVWQSFFQDGDSFGVFAQRFDAGGAPAGAEFQVNDYTTSNQRRPSVATSADGGFVVVWESNGQDGDFSGAFGKRFDAIGTPDGTEFQVNTYTTDYQSRPAVSSDADGSFLVVWDSSTQDGSSAGTFAQRYDASGAADGTEFQVNSYTTEDQNYASVASDGVGNFVVVWSSLVQEDGTYSAGMFGQRLCTDADGDGGCDTRCSLMPATVCTAAAQAKLDYNEKTAGKEKMKLQWKKLAAVTTQAAFGDPVSGTTEVALCIYDDAGTLAGELLVDRAGDTCAGKDCWKAKGTKGYGYKDKDNSSDGVSKIGYTSGAAGKGKADAGGKNNSAKGQTALPVGVVAKLTGNTAPTIQIITSDGFCASATLGTVKKDDGTRYLAQL